MFIDGTPRSYFGRFGNIADLDYWTPTNPTNKNPAPTTGARGPSVRGDASLHRWLALAHSQHHGRLHDRLARVAQRLGLHSVRFYVTAQDPYIHSDYIGIDPEVGGAVPTLRTLLLGSNIVW